MEITRRGFLKLTGAGVLASVIGIGTKEVMAYTRTLKILKAKETTTICPYCAVGCSIILYSRNGQVVNAEGDPDHPINKGALCPKGASIKQLVENPARLVKPRYRAPGAKEWKEVEWSWALDEIAKRIKDSRDKTFVTKNRQGQVVNRCDGIAHIGSSSLDNEECYLLQKWIRSLGIVHIEHQARI